MRFKLTLEVNKRAFGNVLPINYQYEQSAVIYRILAEGSKKYADWLHENGYQLQSGKRFKFFTYSPLKIFKRNFYQEEGHLEILSDTVEWQISFLPEKSTEKFIQGLFANQVFEIGDKKSVVQFWVQKVEVLPAPLFSEEMCFKTMSPICLKFKNEDGKTDYLIPTEERAKEVILYGLKERYKALYKEPLAGDFPFEFTPIGDCKEKKITIKSGTDAQNKVRGYQCKFKIRAPLPLMKIMYESGIGQQCSQGFGCVREGKE